MLAEMIQEARIKRKITPYCFRHGGASWANKKGWSISKIKSQQGAVHSLRVLHHRAVKGWRRDPNMKFEPLGGKFATILPNL